MGLRIERLFSADEVRADNEVAKSLYRKLGFTGYEEPSHPGTLFWERSLRD